MAGMSTLEPHLLARMEANRNAALERRRQCELARSRGQPPLSLASSHSLNGRATTSTASNQSFSGPGSYSNENARHSPFFSPAPTSVNGWQLGPAAAAAPAATSSSAVPAARTHGSSSLLLPTAGVPSQWAPHPPGATMQAPPPPSLSQPPWQAPRRAMSDAASELELDEDLPLANYPARAPGPPSPGSSADSAPAVRDAPMGSSCASRLIELDETCSICFTDTLRDALGKGGLGSLDCCAHIYCHGCILRWTTESSSTCPLCKRSASALHRIEADGTRHSSRAVEARVQAAPEPTEEELAAMLAEADATYNCQLCGSGEDEETILLCDSCDCGYHMACLDPPLHRVPAGDWYCPDCGPTILGPGPGSSRNPHVLDATPSPAARRDRSAASERRRILSGGPRRGAAPRVSQAPPRPNPAQTPHESRAERSRASATGVHDSCPTPAGGSDYTYDDDSADFASRQLRPRRPEPREAPARQVHRDHGPAPRPQPAQQRPFVAPRQAMAPPQQVQARAAPSMPSGRSPYFGAGGSAPLSARPAISGRGAAEGATASRAPPVGGSEPVAKKARRKTVIHESDSEEEDSW